MLFLHTSARGVYIFFAESNLDAINHIQTEFNTQEIKLTKIHAEILYQLKLAIGAKISFILEADTAEKED